LHHATDPALFFEGAARVLQPGAPMVVVDMVQHPHAHFRQTMGDVHLGFEPAHVEALAAEHFHEAAARKLPDTCCTTEGEKVELFALELRR
jgi:ubiquinone/menaquinone biosynthesis C-methylase UbiE